MEFSLDKVFSRFVVLVKHVIDEGKDLAVLLCLGGTFGVSGTN